MSRGLMLGIEVHAQLQAGRKLFSPTPTRFHAPPNSLVSPFDAAIPGTQPILSFDCLNLALKAAVALNSRVSREFSFDRKHYMYPDQPSGYQITQFRQPYATDGYLDLVARDWPQHLKAPSPVQRIRIKQIQIEQDTGKTSYVGNTSLVDLNRANTGLIELVTEPDFTSAEAAVVFIRKLQQLLRFLGVSSGDMETGAMRVDVNVSVGKLTERSEIKNLFSTSAVQASVRAEYARHLSALDRGEKIERETRGWDGTNTFRLRSKESALDYRYMPDPDLPVYRVSPNIVKSISESLPSLPDAVLDRLLDLDVPLVDAKTLLEHDGLAEFYFLARKKFLENSGRNSKLVATWIVHRWLGDDSTSSAPPLKPFLDVILAVDSRRISSTTGKMLLKHIAASPENTEFNVEEVIREYGLEAKGGEELSDICQSVIDSHPDVVARIKGGKKNSISFLLGQVMKDSQGIYSPQDVRRELEKLL